MFAPVFAPFANPEAIVNSKLALAFLNTGWEIDVISRNLAEESSYNYGSGWIEPWLPLRNVTYVVEYPVGGRLRQLAGAFWSGIRMKHIIEGCRWAAHAFDLALRLHRKKPYQIILSRSLPDAGHLPALKMAKITKLPWIGNWNDAWIGCRNNASGDKNSLPPEKEEHAGLGFFHDRFLAEVAKKANWHTFPSERMQQHICQYLKNGCEEKSAAIPHVALKPLYDTNRLKSNKLFTMCYAGYLYSGREPNTFFRAVVEFINSKGVHAKFRLIIVGLENIGLRKLIQEYGLESNVQVTGPISYMETLEICHSSDVLLVIEAPYTEGIYLPSKFVDYVQACRPIMAISPRNGTMNDILSTYGGGIAVDCTSEEEIAKGLRNLYDQWEKGTLDKKFSSERLYKLFSPEKIINSYRKIFEKLLHE